MVSGPQGTDLYQNRQVALGRVGRAAGGVTIKKRQLGGWAEAAAALIREIETGAPSGNEVAALPVLGRPRLADWLVLGATVAVLYGLSLLPA